MFDAIVHRRIDLEGLEFEVTLADIEALNHAAFARSVDVTKLSFHAYAHCAADYVLLDAGSALGRNCGPLLISLRQIGGDEVAAGNLKIAIPGRYTTANFLLGLAFPRAQKKVEMVFSDIEAAVLDGRVDAGLIIHENRFTYEAKGLRKIIDLGEFWEEKTREERREGVPGDREERREGVPADREERREGVPAHGAPIPLGGIVARRSLPLDVQHRMNRVMRRSVEYAFAHPEASREYVRAHAQEMSEDVMYRHIDLYVNEYSVDLGEAGRRAVRLLFDRAHAAGIIEAVQADLFVGSAA